MRRASPDLNEKVYQEEAKGGRTLGEQLHLPENDFLFTHSVTGGLLFSVAYDLRIQDMAYGSTA